MSTKDEFGLFQGYTASFKDFMGGGATTDLLQFLGENAPTQNGSFLTTQLSQESENLQLKQQINQLQAQVFDLQSRNSALQQRLNEAEFQQNGELQRLFEENLALQKENEILRQNGQHTGQNQKPNEDAKTLADICRLLSCQRPDVVGVLQQQNEQFVYQLKKLQKDAEEIKFYQTQAARITQVCRENIIMIRKQTEAITGWRLNLEDEMRAKVERAGDPNIWFQVDRGRIVGSSVVGFSSSESTSRVLAHFILGM